MPSLPFAQRLVGGAILSGLLTLQARADIVMPDLFSDHMVLQRGSSVPIWGTADPGEEVAISFPSVAGDKSPSYRTVADEGGRWQIRMDLSSISSEPFEIVLEGKNKLTLSDVVVGTVWLASGQSNMEMMLESSVDGALEVKNSANAGLRHFRVEKATGDQPSAVVKGHWEVASPETSGKFTAVGYYFGKRLQEQLQIPVGLIHASWGGAPVETWISLEALAAMPEVAKSTNLQREALRDALAARESFQSGFRDWLENTARQEKEPDDPASFAKGDTDGWIPVTIPGPPSNTALPLAGTTWFRREVKVPPERAGKVLRLEFDDPVGFERVYWNGTLIRKTTFETHPGKEERRRINVPPHLVTEGNNTLAIRLFSPSAPAMLPAAPVAGEELLDGEWMAKGESFFATSPEQETPAPPPIPANGPNAWRVGTQLFNGMIAPLIPYKIEGVIWYQGEADVRRAHQYGALFSLLISDWRNRWQQPDLPFYFCQLANYGEKAKTPQESPWAELREAQSSTLKLSSHTGQAVLIDLGEAGDIHPRNKKPAGERLAAIALAKTYQQQIPFSGPVVKSLTIRGHQLRLAFNHIEGGLVAKELPETYPVRTLFNQTAPLIRHSPESELEGFSIAGSDRKWHWANAKIEGDTVIVWSEKVPRPVAVRYGWANNPTCNLFNKAGFPASPFQTDFPTATAGSR